jgi:hypothetical protein
VRNETKGGDVDGTDTEKQKDDRDEKQDKKTGRTLKTTI